MEHGAAFAQQRRLDGAARQIKGCDLHSMKIRLHPGPLLSQNWGFRQIE